MDRMFWLTTNPKDGLRAFDDADAALGAAVAGVEAHVERLEARVLSRSTRGAAAFSNLAAMLLDTARPLQFLPDYEYGVRRLPLASSQLFLRCMLMLLRCFLLIAGAMLGSRCWREGVAMLSRAGARVTFDMLSNVVFLALIVTYFAWRYVSGKEHAQVVRQAEMIARARRVAFAEAS